MALRADERWLIADANMHLPGRQVDPQRVRRDLQRLAHWEREHDESIARSREGGLGRCEEGMSQTMARDGGRDPIGAGNVRPA
jgi:hypothetical protein